MEYPKKSKKKHGKCCCGSRPLIKRLPYASITTLDEAFPPLVGSAFQVPPNTFVGLWSTVRPVRSPTGAGQTCLNGPLKTWFNVADGKFTYRESGLYETTFSGSIVGDIPTGTTGTVYMTIEGFLKDGGQGRCQNPLTLSGNTQPLNPADFNLGGPPLTVNAVRPNIPEDHLEFGVYLDTPGLSTPLQMLFEINVVQLSRLDQNKIFDTTIVTES